MIQQLTDTLPANSGATYSATTNSVTTNPVASNPVVTNPVTSKPVASNPVASNPVASKHITATPLPTDTVAADTVAAKPKEFGIILQAPPVPEVEPVGNGGTGLSWILTGMAFLFFIVGLRFRNNSKFIPMMLRNLKEVRMRSNSFDETVKETSYMALLDILWCCSAGIILWATIGSGLIFPDLGIPSSIITRQATTLAICICVALLYGLIMSVSYLMVGTVFADLEHAKVWLKGFLAGLGLLSGVYFPLSLVILFNPQWIEILLSIALFFFIIAKILFIWKGFRIFFTQISSWVLFLYYLCSLEIVPLILAYLAARWLCSLI